MEKHQVIVIGAGIAGLTAGYELKKKGMDVIVLEADSRPGGRMITDNVNGYIIDAGAQFLVRSYPILMKLIKELGLKNKLSNISPYVGIVRDRKIRKLNRSNPYSPLFSGFLKLNEWSRLGWKTMKLVSKSILLPVNNYSAWHDYDNEDAAVWSNFYYGHTLTEYFIEPMLQGFMFQTLEEMSKALPASVLHFGTRNSRPVSLSNGIGMIPEQIASHLNVLYNIKVINVFVQGNSVVIHTDKGAYEADKIILATTSSAAKRIYNGAGVEETLMETQYSSTINVAIAVKKNWQNDLNLRNIYGILIPRNERKVLADIIIGSGKRKKRVQSGDLIFSMLSGDAAAKMFKWDEKDILAVVLSELEKYFKGISKEIIFTKLYRWKEAEPRSPVGRSKNIHYYRNSITDSNRILLAGDYMGMSFTEGAAETGKWAASRILNGINKL